MTLKRYLATLPERLVRSVVGLGAGVAREVGDVALPQSVRQSRLYQNLVDTTLRFLIEQVGEVDGVYASGEKLADDFLARRTVANAVEALGRLGDDRAVEKLMQGMLDEHMGVRQAAARALMMLDPYWDRSPQAQTFLPQLEVALRHRQPAVQFAAVTLLRRLTGKSSLEMNTTRLAKSAGTSQDQLLDIFEVLARDPDDEGRDGARRLGAHGRGVSHRAVIRA